MYTFMCQKEIEIYHVLLMKYFFYFFYFFQRLSRLREEERNHLENRKKKFFSEIVNAFRDFQLQIQATLKRRKQRNDGVQVLRSFKVMYFYSVLPFIW